MDNDSKKEKQIVIHQNQSKKGKILSEQASQKAAMEAEEAQKKLEDDFNKNHEVYVVDFKEYQHYYLIDKINHIVKKVGIYDDSEEHFVETATYTGNVDARIEFTFICGENDRYPMFVYHKYAGMDNYAVFVGAEDHLDNKGKKVDVYQLSKKYFE